MRPRFAFVGRGADRVSVEERRVGDDATGQFRQPRLAALPRVERVEPQDARARLKPVALRVAFRKRRRLRIDLKTIDGGERVALREREADRADARADVDDPALPSVARRRNQQRGVRPDPVAAFRLHEHEPAAEPPVLGQPPGAALSSSADGSAIEQFFSQTRFDNEAASPPFLFPVDQNPPRQEAERAFDGGHVLVGDEIGDPLRLQDRLDNADENEIVGAQDFDQKGPRFG